MTSLVMALEIGISEEQFWRMNPRKLRPYVEAEKGKYENRMKEQEMVAHMHNLYTARAIGSCFSKNSKYPDKLLNIFDFDKENDGELSENEIKRQREALMLNLQIMQANFELKKQERVPS